MKIYIYSFLILFFTSCLGFKDATLSVDKPLVQLDSAAMNITSIPVMEYNKGFLYNEKTDLSKWEVSHGNLDIQRKGTSLVINLRDVGNDWEQLSRRFQPLDFSDAQCLLIKARLDVNCKDSLKMRIDLVDEDGFITNYNLQEKFIRSRSDFKIYKFNYNGAWTQGWPVRADVNPKKIVEIKISFNGGGPNYTGTIYIDEISASNCLRIVSNPENFSLQDFGDGTSGWWAGSKIKLSGAEVEMKEVMKLNFDETGPGWEGFGRKFDQAVDFSKTPVVRVRMKADNAGVLRIDLHDVKERSTNAKPAVQNFLAGNEYVDIFYDFSDRFNQTHPNNQIVDSTQIGSIACFVNPPVSPAFSGNILIDDISVMSIEEYNKLKK